MVDVKNALITQVIKEANRCTLDQVLTHIKKELDCKTEEIVEDVLKKRQGKDIYLKAREEVKSYLSMKKEDK